MGVFGEHFLVMVYWGCAPQAGWGCIFMTGSTKMGLHFQAFFNGVAHLWNFGSKKILTSRNRSISGKKFVAIFSAAVCIFNKWLP